MGAMKSEVRNARFVKLRGSSFSGVAEPQGVFMGFCKDFGKVA